MNAKLGFPKLVLWLARGLAVCLFLFWGAFFGEHIQEWFIAPFPEHPPLRVCVTVGWHGLLLMGLLLLLRWQLIGSLIVLVAGGVFFFSVAGKSALLFFGITALPAVLSLYCWWERRHGSADPAPAGLK